MNAKNVGRFGQAFRAAKGQDFSNEMVCYNCQKNGHVATFCPQSTVARQSSRTASRSPGKVRRCYGCQSTQRVAPFCTKTNSSGGGDGQTAQATISASFSNARISPAACAFSRDVVTGARMDEPTGVCAFSHDETTGAQVCVVSDQQVDGESSEWAFGDFPKIYTAIANINKARMNGVKLSTLRYIEVDVEGRQCKGLVDSGAEICLISEELASEMHANECGHIGVRGIFSDPILLLL